MTALDPKANDFVAEKLGLWTRGQRCSPKYEIRWDQSVWCLTCNQQFRAPVAGPRQAYTSPFQHRDHDVPAPDLLANPWRLVEALWKKAVQVEFNVFYVVLLDLRSGKNLMEKIIDGDLARALLQAAYNMLTEENHGR